MPPDDPSSAVPSEQSALLAAREAFGKRLLETITDPARFAKELADQTRKASERGQALAIISKLDAALADALKARMIVDEKATNVIFGDSGSLQSLGAKVRLGYLLGLYGKQVYRDLLLISKIRNDFAHKAEAEEYKWDRIQSFIRELKVFNYVEEKLGFNIVIFAVDALKDVGVNVKIDGVRFDIDTIGLGGYFNISVILITSLMINTEKRGLRPVPEV